MSLAEVILNEAEKDFLKRLRDGTKLLPAGRDQNKIRQKLRLHRYVEWKGGCWRLTETGRAVLAKIS